MAVGAILFSFADSADKYWSHIFPGMIFIMIGLGSAYVGANVAIMGNARKGDEVSACFFKDFCAELTFDLLFTAGRCRCLDEYVVPAGINYWCSR